MANRGDRELSNGAPPPPPQMFPFYLGGPLQPPQPLPPVLAATARTFGVVRVCDNNKLVKAIPFTSFPQIHRYNFLVDTILAADLDYAHGRDRLVAEDRQLIAEETDMDIMLAPVEHAGKSVMIHVERNIGRSERDLRQQSRGRRRHDDLQTDDSWVIDDFERHVSMSPAPREHRKTGDYYRPGYRDRYRRSPGRERTQTPMERTFGGRDDWHTRGGRIKRERSWSIDRELSEPQKRAKLSMRLVKVPTMAELEQAVDNVEEGRIVSSGTFEDGGLGGATTNTKKDGEYDDDDGDGGLGEATADTKKDGEHDDDDDGGVVVSNEDAPEENDKPVGPEDGENAEA